jgi:Helitron helicase-like domain at N-terminus
MTLSNVVFRPWDTTHRCLTPQQSTSTCEDFLSTCEAVRQRSAALRFHAPEPDSVRCRQINTSGLHAPFIRCNSGLHGATSQWPDILSPFTARNTVSVGSNEIRYQMGGQIWSTSVFLGPPSLWITINPSDINNPIAQLFAGESITQITNFGSDLDSQKRAKNVADDPYAAAKNFHFLIRKLQLRVTG